MPITRPAVISDRVSLADKLTGFVWPLVPEDGALNTDLSRVADVLSPDEHGVAGTSAENDVPSWPNKLRGAEISA